MTNKPLGIECLITESGLVVSCTGSIKGNGRALTNEQLAELRAEWRSSGIEAAYQSLYSPVDVMCQDCASVARETIATLSEEG